MFGKCEKPDSSAIIMKAMLIERYKDMEFIKLRNEILKMFKILKESHSDDDIETCSGG